MEEPVIILAPGREKSLERKHPLVFSGAISKMQGNPRDGAAVEVVSSTGRFLGLGHYQEEGSISVRILSFEKTTLDHAFWLRKINAAFQLRNFMGLCDVEHTNTYRLVHGEGDGLAGLIIDHYAGNLVIQAHSWGMHLVRHELAKACEEVYGKSLKSIYYKSSETLHTSGEKVENHFLFGEEISATIALENMLQFKVNWVDGQKTGFFVDQRDNRALLGKLSKNKKVLNTFCYTGGFSIAALKGGASLVHSVDSSRKAIDLTDENIALNAYQDRHTSICDDTLHFLRNTEEEYDIVILDPPAYAKSVRNRHKAVQGYKRLNAEALKRIPSGGLLFTFSCSQVVDRSLFEHTITAAAIESRRNIKVLYHLNQPPDHPVSIFHPEGEYLKGLVLLVE